MRTLPFALVLASSLAIICTAGPSVEGSAELQQLEGRDGHSQGHHVAPLLELDETEVSLRHQPTPPSYYTIDWEDPEHASSRHPGLIITHAIFTSLAFFVFLPMDIALRSVKHSLRAAAAFGFYASFVLACAASSVYKKLTPDMYPNASHARHGYLVLAVALLLSFIDAFGAVCRISAFMRSAKSYSLKGFSKAFLGREDSDGKDPEYTSLIGEELDSIDHVKNQHHPYDETDNPSRSPDFNHENTELWANHARISSTGSDGTVFAPASRSEETLHELQFIPRISFLRRVGRAAFKATQAALIAGFGLFLTGIVIYTGGCRQKYINGCLAHIISKCIQFIAQGGIFWSYGLISFARFLGWCSELGWAWNRAPSSGYPTAEFVESFLIFFYGITNTWMERFSALPGDPYTTKQIQHIGIAVMFWFAGLLGMAVESKSFRKWLAASSVKTSEPAAEHTKYTLSLNPFPAIVFGVTGSVMAAHFQTYLFQVQIHALWGNLIFAFAILRCATYCFLWVAPPRSTLPSRPPTEALGSFFLACGGASFIFSTEEVTIAAMRRGRDDIMMFAVVAVAITCLAFCWTISFVGFHGWLKSRANSAVSQDTIRRV
ncbi:cytoplasmic protein [Mycena crocata]|nr:cytoplasmic protein [Mycena crocata]